MDIIYCEVSNSQVYQARAPFLIIVCLSCLFYLLSGTGCSRKAGNLYHWLDLSMSVCKILIFLFILYVNSFQVHLPLASIIKYYPSRGNPVVLFKSPGYGHFKSSRYFSLALDWSNKFTFVKSEKFRFSHSLQSLKWFYCNN